MIKNKSETLCETPVVVDGVDDDNSTIESCDDRCGCDSAQREMLKYQQRMIRGYDIVPPSFATITTARSMFPHRAVPASVPTTPVPGAVFSTPLPILKKLVEKAGATVAVAAAHPPPPPRVTFAPALAPAPPPTPIPQPPHAKTPPPSPVTALTPTVTDVPPPLVLTPPPVAKEELLPVALPVLAQKWEPPARKTRAAAVKAVERIRVCVAIDQRGKRRKTT